MLCVSMEPQLLLCPSPATCSLRMPPDSIPTKPRFRRWARHTGCWSQEKPSASRSPPRSRVLCHPERRAPIREAIGTWCRRPPIRGIQFRFKGFPFGNDKARNAVRRSNRFVMQKKARLSPRHGRDLLIRVSSQLAYSQH
jgi:hypothetical protein